MHVLEVLKYNFLNQIQTSHSHFLSSVAVDLQK